MIKLDMLNGNYVNVLASDTKLTKMIKMITRIHYGSVETGFLVYRDGNILLDTCDLSAALTVYNAITV